MPIDPLYPFRPSAKYEGVRPLNIYLLRLLYILMFFVLGQLTWTHILIHQGPWDPFNAVAWCVWTAFATLAGLGILRPLKFLPIILLEIFYKVLWLILVAYPLWTQRHSRHLTRCRHHHAIPMGDPSHRSRALGIRLRALRLQPAARSSSPNDNPTSSQLKKYRAASKVAARSCLAHSYPFRNFSNAALTVSACVVGMPCGKSLYVISVPCFSSFADERPGSLVRNNLVVIAMHHQHRHVDPFNPLVKSVSENALMQS